MARSTQDAAGEQRAAGRREREVTLATKVAFLSRCESYPERPATVEAVETRLSWVFLTPSRAWKLKKPLCYDHLDFSDLEARRHDCEEEVRLNRPLAPDVYLGVEPLVVSGDGALAIAGSGRTIDYLVCMRRLPRERCLEDRLQVGEPDTDRVTRAAQTLAVFYRDAPRAGAVDVDAIAAEVDEEARELETLPLGPRAGASALHERLQQALAERREQLVRRQRHEVHGDLRPQHVYLTDPPVFLDRLTFRRELRLMDPIEELAFLALDCERLGAGWVGATFLDTYARVTGDEAPADLVACYRARRAMLWALLSGRHLVRGADVRSWREVAREYLRLGLESLS